MIPRAHADSLAMRCQPQIVVLNRNGLAKMAGIMIVAEPLS